MPARGQSRNRACCGKTPACAAPFHAAVRPGMTGGGGAPAERRARGGCAASPCSPSLAPYPLRHPHHPTRPSSPVIPRAVQRGTRCAADTGSCGWRCARGKIPALRRTIVCCGASGMTGEGVGPLESKSATHPICYSPCATRHSLFATPRATRCGRRLLALSPVIPCAVQRGTRCTADTGSCGWASRCSWQDPGSAPHHSHAAARPG